ncbi:TetR family transcriptional regulator [Spirillospora sp. CA-142024]|uniref:TetR family transcriptional regulator n=1 Tax=Spirillospora sp. CA-142024 TaxID=3240036 RepID=UPI003D8ACA9E
MGALDQPPAGEYGCGQGDDARPGERGYGEFTVGDVAAHAGVADTGVYRRWGPLPCHQGPVFASGAAAGVPGVPGRSAGAAGAEQDADLPGRC